MRHFALYMPYICLIYALYMPYICLIYASYMPCICLIYALYMPYICLIYALYMYNRLCSPATSVDFFFGFGRNILLQVVIKVPSRRTYFGLRHIHPREPRNSATNGLTQSKSSHQDGRAALERVRTRLGLIAFAPRKGA